MENDMLKLNNDLIILCFFTSLPIDKGRVNQLVENSTKKIKTKQHFKMPKYNVKPIFSSIFVY